MTRLLAALGLFIPVPLLVAADWPQWRGVNRDGISAESVAPWKGELKAVWRKDVGEGNSSPVVANGRVFLHAKVADKEREEVIAFDAKAGNEVWRQSYERASYKNIYGNGPRATPVVDGDKLYTFGVTGILICWDAATGKEIWKLDVLKEFQATNLFFGASSSPLVFGNKLLVLVGGPEASIVALDKMSGKMLWRSGTDKASYASPILTKQGNTQLAVFLTQKGVVALNPEDGKEHWKFPLVDRLNESSTTPVRAGDVIFASSVTFGSVGIKLTTENGKPAHEQLWKNDLNCYFSTPVAVGDHLYVVSVVGPLLAPNAQLQCLEAKTGKALWTRKNVGKYHATVMLAKDRLLMLEEPGDLVLIEPDPKEFKELARAKVCGKTWAHPALSDGRLFVRDEKELICVELGAK